MSSLLDYKAGLISARNQLYNTAVAKLNNDAQTAINVVTSNNLMSKKAKTTKINAIVRARNNALNVLKKQLSKDIAAINNITSVPIPPILNIPPRTTPSKIAVLVGINYNGTSKQLRGCINDTVKISTLLINKYGYSSDNIMFLTDNTASKPTKSNIINAFANLLKNAISGDSLCFFYSGHGTYLPNNRNVNRSDKNDECIYPIDGKIITDIELKQIVDANMKANVHFVALFDSCFSGTIMNLRYNYKYSDNNGNTWINTNDALTVGTVICISGCTDSQTSDDAYIDGTYDGAMTWALTTTIATSPGPLSWTQLIDNIRSLLISSTFTQLPQLSSGNNIDIAAAVTF